MQQQSTIDDRRVSTRAVYPITERQLDVLRLACEGLRHDEIAARLGLSRRTVEHHKYTLMERCQVRTTAQLVFHAVQQGWLRLDDPVHSSTNRS